jgi:hypothetical protein
MSTTPTESERLEELEEHVERLYDCVRGLALEVIDPELVWDGEHWSSGRLGVPA